MAFNIVSGGVVRHISYCTYNGQVSTTKRDWQCTLITGGANIPSSDVLDSLNLMMAANLKDLMTEDALYYGSQLYYQTPVGPRPRPDHTTASQGGGNVALHGVPSQVCGLVSLYTDTLGKIGQGRVYVPFVPLDHVGPDGLPTAAYVTNLEEFGDDLITPRVITAGGINATFVGVLYTPGGDPPKPFTSRIARSSFATQRRRGSFGRLNSNPF